MRRVLTILTLTTAACAPVMAFAAFDPESEALGHCGQAQGADGGWSDPLAVDVPLVLTGAVEGNSLVVLYHSGTVGLQSAVNIVAGDLLSPLPDNRYALIDALGPPIAGGTVAMRCRRSPDSTWVEVRWIGGGTDSTRVTLRLTQPMQPDQARLTLTLGFDHCGERVLQRGAARAIGVRVRGVALSTFEGDALKCDPTRTPRLGATVTLPVVEPDRDGDLIPDGSAEHPGDNCVNVPNLSQLNTDAIGGGGDGRGDACDCDDDNDLVPEEGYDPERDGDCVEIPARPDNCPLVYNPAPSAALGQTDTDGDGFGDACDDDDDNDLVPDAVDNCPLVANRDQRDSDGGLLRLLAPIFGPFDRRGDACDDDDDDDGVPDAEDNCPLVANAPKGRFGRDRPLGPVPRGHGQTDTDGDGLGDACDPDRDGDFVIDVLDNCPMVANGNQTNVDGDRWGDACDDDLDGDGVPNSLDGCPWRSGTSPASCVTDSDGDGRPDGAADTCPLIADDQMPDKDRDGKGRACDENDDDHLDSVVDACDLDCQWTAPGPFEPCRQGQAAPGRRLQDQCCIGAAALALRDHPKAFAQVCHSMTARPLVGRLGPPEPIAPWPRSGGPGAQQKRSER